MANPWSQMSSCDVLYVIKRMFDHPNISGDLSNCLCNCKFCSGKPWRKAGLVLKVDNKPTQESNENRIESFKEQFNLDKPVLINLRT